MLRNDFLAAYSPSTFDKHDPAIAQGTSSEHHTVRMESCRADRAFVGRSRTIFGCAIAVWGVCAISRSTVRA